MLKTLTRGLGRTTRCYELYSGASSCLIAVEIKIKVCVASGIHLIFMFTYSSYFIELTSFPRSIDGTSWGRRRVVSELFPIFLPILHLAYEGRARSTVMTSSSAGMMKMLIYYMMLDSGIARYGIHLSVRSWARTNCPALPHDARLGQGHLDGRRRFSHLL